MTESYGYDKTPTPPRDYDASKVPAEIKKRATWVKTKFTGEDVAEAYGQAMEITGIYSDEAKKIAQQNKVRQDNLETQTAQSVAQMEADKNTIVANATVDSEVILARGGKATLGQRLDETTAQLAQTKHVVTNVSANKENKAVVTFIDDDGNRAVLSKLKPISERQNVPFVLALIGDYVARDIGVTATEALDLQNELGWEIASHSYNHPGFLETGITKEAIEHELKYSAEFLRSKGLDVKNFVYPGGQYDDMSKRLVSKYYNSGIGTGASINTAPYRNYMLYRLEYPQPFPNNNLAYYKQKVDEAVSEKAWLIWMLHCGQEAFTQEQTEILEQLIIYIKSLSVDILTVQEALDETGNVISVNDNQFYMTASGENNITDYKHVPISSQTGFNQVNFDTPPSLFEMDKTTVSTITNPLDVAKSPSKYAGVLTTVRTVNNSFQRYTDGQPREFVRYISGDSWGAWRMLTTARPMRTITIDTFSVPANDFREKSISLGMYTKNVIVILNPRTKMPLGITFTHYTVGLNGEVYIVFRNNLQSAVTINTIEWDYVLLDTYQM